MKLKAQKKTFIIKYGSTDICKTCKKHIVPNLIYINDAWGTKKQIDAQGGTVGEFSNDICESCVGKGKGEVVCSDCNKSKQMKDIFMVFREQYDEEDEYMCVDCVNKYSPKQIIERFSSENTEVIRILRN